MTRGIYCYMDTENNNEIVYIGKDSNIDESRRDKQHKSPAYYNLQKINKIIQNNPPRFKYGVLIQAENDVMSPTLLQIFEIGYIHKYNPRFNFTIGGDGVCGLKVSEETRNQISKTLSKNKTKTGVLGLYKMKNNRFRQGFCWHYRYYENNQRKSLTSVDLDKLKKKVKDKGLEWIVIDEEKAMGNGLGVI